MRKIVLLLFAGLWITPVLAQAECADIVRQALDTTAESCGSTGRNEVCYGNVSLTAEQQTWVTAFDFDEQGDITNIAAVAHLTLSSQVEETGDWGIALMNIQANLPDTLPGQNVMFLLFGDVEITNGVETNAEPVELQIEATSNANVRSRPSTGAAVIGSLGSGDVVTADGRLEDGSWLRVRMAEGGGGWVFAELVTVDGDAEILNSYDPDTPVYGAMQAFYFRSGVGDSPCADAPDSGILIQTPDDVGTITLSVNGADIQLGSTAYLQAQPGGDMVVNVIEGEAEVTAQGATVAAPAGTRVRVALDGDLEAEATPEGPEPYVDAELAALPVGYLVREIAVAPALTEEEIEALFGLVPLPGTWQSNLVSTDCARDVSGSQFTLTVQDGGATMTIGEYTYSRTIPGVYVITYPFVGGGTVTATVTFLSPVSASDFIEYSADACTIEFNLTRIGD